MIGKCHQRLIREKFLNEDLANLPTGFSHLKASSFDLQEEKITNEIINFIKKYEWLGTLGSTPKWCFTARFKGYLGGVALITEPNSYSKILGQNTRQYEALIQRGACASWTPKNLASRLIMFSCKSLVHTTSKRLFVAYSDPEANEIGTVYQSCNFDFLGYGFGAKYNYTSKDYKNGSPFSRQTLSRTSTLKNWCRDNGVTFKKDWLKENGFKDISKIPSEILYDWKLWQKKIIKNSNKIIKSSKGKYAIILGKNKKEINFLKTLKNYKTFAYPKRG